MSENIDIFNIEEVDLGLDNKDDKKYFTRLQIINANKTERCIPSKIMLDGNASKVVVSDSEQVENQEVKTQEEINKSKGKRRKKVKSEKVSKAKQQDLIRNIDSSVSKTCEVSEFENEATSKATSVYTLLSDSRRLYDSCIYELRQKLFSLLSDDENAVFNMPYTYNQLYNVMKNEDAYINTTLDTYTKTYVIKQAIESWKGFTHSIKSFIKSPLF